MWYKYVHVVMRALAFLSPHGHMIGRKLLAMQYHEGLPSKLSLNTWCMANSPTPAAVAKVQQPFPRVFVKLREADHSFSSAS